MTEIVYINLPGPTEPAPGMSGGELLHGFLAELYLGAKPEVKEYINDLWHEVECSLSQNERRQLVSLLIVRLFLRSVS